TSAELLPVTSSSSILLPGSAASAKVDEDSTSGIIGTWAGKLGMGTNRDTTTTLDIVICEAARSCRFRVAVPAHASYLWWSSFLWCPLLPD
ncbi:unnamed protein product, partial [Amoebophrya sp. A25]